MQTIRKPTLPQELVDNVIDHLHANERALMIVSLVCKQWIPSSRYHLFRTVVLFPYNCGMFLDLLEWPWCTLPPHVISVELAYSRNVPLNEIFQRLSRLFALRRLAFHGTPQEDTRTLISCSFKQLVHLTMYDYRFQSFHELANFLSSFSSLGSITLRGLCTTEFSKSFDTRRLSSNLKSLNLDSSAHDILSWLMSHVPVPSTTSVDLHLVPVRDFSLIQKYLDAIGGSLWHLALHCLAPVGREGKYLTATSIMSKFNPNLLTELRTLEVSSGIDVTMFIKILSQITSPHIELLWFTIIINSDSNHQESLGEPWANVDAILGRPQFSCLRKLIICLDRGFRDGGESIRGFLPSCAARGILEMLGDV